MRSAILSICFLAASAQLAHGQMTTVIDEDFESGLGAWTPRAAQPSPMDLNGTPILFSPTDSRLWDNINNPGSQSVGFSSNQNPWDRSLAAWLEKRFNVAPRKYAVRLELDVYIYKDPQYRADEPRPDPDPYSTGNRLILLTDDGYNNPCVNFDGGLPSGGLRKSYWPGDSGFANNGKWQHVVAFHEDTHSINTEGGQMELRLLFHEKYKGKEAVAWDNVVLTLRDFDNKTQILYTIQDDFEAGWGGWTLKNFEANHPHDDTPVTFTATDSRLVTNTGNPGSASAGFTTTSCPDDTRAAWLTQLFPGLLTAGTYMVEIEADAYVYKDPLKDPTQPQALVNRMMVLTDDNYDQPTVAFGPTDPLPDATADLWRGYGGGGGTNGIWHRVNLRQEITTTTGNFEVRLLMQHEVFLINPASGTDLPEPSLWSLPAGPQAVAWDNVQVRIGPGCYEPRFDRDGDKDVDQEDFAAWQTCFTGSAGGYNANRCRCLNADGNDRIDSQDLLAFEVCAATSGPMVDADDACDDGLSPP